MGQKFHTSGYFGPPTKGHVIQRMRDPQIAMVRYVQPQGCLMTLQVSLKLQHQSSRNVRTIFGQRKCVRRCSIMTSTNPRWRTAAIMKIAKSP